MPTRRAEHFVLWGVHCDEAVAAIFVTTLRGAGLWVKVVGISGRRWTGAHGLALTPDLTLGQAQRLAAHTRCVIIPCNLAQLPGFLNDPRLGEFLACTCRAQAIFVVGEANPLPTTLLAPVELRIYPRGAALVCFAQQLAVRLVQGERAFGEDLGRSR
jgi:hypothetical protein